MGEPSLLKSTLIGSAQANVNGSAQHSAATNQSPVITLGAQNRGSSTSVRSSAQPTSANNAKVGYTSGRNYIKGYKKRWFVLENGYLSYYRNKGEVAHTCRGTINVVTATVQHEDPLMIIVQNGATNVFHLKAPNEIERQLWLSKLHLARAHAAEVVSTAHAAANADAAADEDDDEADPYSKDNEHGGPEFDKQLATLSTKMESMRTYFTLTCKHHADVLQLLDHSSPPSPTKTPTAPLAAHHVKSAGLANRHSAVSASAGALSEFANARDKELVEKLLLFKSTSRAFLSACHEYYDTATQQGRRWQRLLEREHEQRVQFEGVVEQLARQQRQLEKQALREFKSTRVSVSPQLQPASAALNGGTADVADAQMRAPLLACNPPQIASSPNDSDDDDANDDFYDALDFEAPPSAPAAVKSSPSYDTLSTASSQDSITSLPSSSRPHETNIVSGGAPPAPKSGGKASIHQRSQSDWSSTQQALADATAPQRSQSKLSVLSPASASLRDALQKPPVPADGPFVVSVPRTRPRRTAIPFKPASSLNLWSIIKNCVGRELSKIPFPVNFSEPISMLQRLVEDVEYSPLLDRAAECSDPVEQMALVAAFNISSYASTALRVTKPFNPVLGETYEMDRTDEPEFGWRMIAEQVSHHPPAAAFHCESAKWICFEEFTLGSKFRGMYLQVQPLGESHCEFKRDGNHYTWTRVTTMINNIIVGKLWIDNIGECVVINHTLGMRCYLKFVQYSFFHSEMRRVVGVIKDRNGEARYVLSGTWDDKMEGAWLKRVPPGTRNPYANLEPDGVIKVWQSIDPAEKKLLWRRKDFPPNSEKMYNFTTFAIQLNEEEPGVAPTDSRMRPDQRLMEQGLWDAANTEKLRIEEKQRTSRRALEKANEQRGLNGLPAVNHEPIWFKKQRDPYTDTNICKYTGEYWACKRRSDWSKSPDIF